MDAQFELSQLRARVLAALGSAQGVVLVAAPGPAADAGSVALNLCRALAESGHGTMLIEAASVPTGLSGSLSGGAESLAHVLAAGPPEAPGGQELPIYAGLLSPATIAGRQLGDWIARAGQTGVVVLLTGNLADSADALALSAVTDLSILVVCEGETRRRQLAQAVKALRRSGREPLGLVAARARLGRLYRSISGPAA